MSKKEDFDDKRKRVYKTLENTLKSGKKIVKLTDDERVVLLSDYWANSDCKNFNFPSVANKDPWDATITAEIFAAGFQEALQDAIEYAKEKKLIDPSYSIGDNWNNSVQVVGFRPISDQKLIDRYTKGFQKELKIKEKAKQVKKKHVSSKAAAIKEIARLAKQFDI